MDHVKNYLILDFTMTLAGHFIVVYTVVYPSSENPVHFTQLLSIVKLKYGRKNHNWIFGEQNFKGFLNE